MNVNEKKAKEIAKKHMPFAGVPITECIDTALEMAEWKDSIVQGFLFELSLLLTKPKTDIEHAICSAFPMSGLNAIDEVGDFLREKFWEYENEGTILKDK